MLFLRLGGGIRQGIQNVVAHHSHGGATTLTAEGIADADRREHHADIAGLHEPGSIRIEDHEAALVRAHAGPPRHVRVFGYSYDIDTGGLTEAVRDEAGVVRRA